MKLSFKGKSSIVTGASGGMGLEVSHKLSKSNIQVLMLDLRSPSKEFLLRNKNCHFKKVDVTNFKKMKTCIDSFFETSKPIPPLAPVTTADFPLKLNFILLFFS